VNPQRIQVDSWYKVETLNGLWTHSQYKLTVDIDWYKVETLNGLWTHSQYKMTVDIKLKRWMACEPTANTSWQLILFNVSTLYQSISTVNLYWLRVHKPFNVSTLYQLSTCIRCGFTSHSTFQLYINQYQLSTCIGCGFTSHSSFQLYINCQPTANTSWQLI
jgi:predicted secreted protein